MATEEINTPAEKSESQNLERQWLSATVNRKEYKKFSEQISNWTHNSQQYFKSGFANNVAKKIRNNEEVGINNPANIKGATTLPLSGDGLNFKYIDRDSLFEFAINSSTFTGSAEFQPEKWLDLRAESGALETYIQNSRNLPIIEKDTEKLQLQGHDMEFFVQVTNIARAFCGPFAKKNFFAPHNDSKYLACTIDNQLFSLLLTIESLDLEEMAKACSLVMERFANGAKLFYEFCASICEDKKSIDDLKEIARAAKSIAKSCDKYKKTSTDFNKHGGGNGQQIANQCKKFLQLTKKPIGDVIVISAGSQSGFFRNAGWNPKNIPFGGEEFDIADKFAVEIINEIFSPEQTSASNEEALGTEIFSTKFINAATFLQERLCSEEYQYPERYDRILTDITQLNATLRDSDASGGAINITMKWQGEIEKTLGHLKNKNSPSIEMTECIAKPPQYYQEKIDNLYAEKGIGHIYSSRISNFEKTALGGNESQEDLLSIFKEKLELKEIEGALNDVMTRLRDANTLRGKKLVDINRSGRGEAARIVADIDKKEISDAKKVFEDTYLKAFSELEDGLSGREENDLQPVQLLNNFEIKISQSIEVYRNTLEESGYSGDSNASGVGVLMIGMGQGGQQILRASMAKMLNTLTDERSRNMLNGLGVKKDDIEKIKTISAETDSFSDLEKMKEYKEGLHSIFDKVGILAMNLGPELKDLLSQPYNFIWGDPKSKEIKHYSDGKVRRLATNLALLDPNSKGCGGKMGRGRAFAVDAEESLAAILAEKSNQRTITQICLIHSFTGGSGSGMVLPMLRKIKHTYPEAVVWVLSAGDGQTGGAANGPQNVTYITSDVLQSHYNALHHSPQKIDRSKWEQFKLLNNDLKNLNTKWDTTIKPYFDDLDNVNLKGTIDDKMEKYSQAERLVNGIFGEMKSENLFACLPDSKDKAENFEEMISDPTNDNAENLWNAWVSWLQLAEDNGSRELQIAANDEKLFQKDKDNTKARFKTIRGHFIKIALKLKRLNKAYEEETQEFSRFVNSLNTEALKADEKDIEVLSDDISKYARAMRDYHYKIYEMSELISLNRGVSDDPTVKHIIVSNAHLDPAAGAIYQGKQEKYEIYNSTMTEVFVNVVHSLVNEADEVLSFENDGLSASSYEVMDVSDMRNRTKPTTTAMVIEIEDMSKIDHFVRYNSVTITEHKVLYEIFEKLLKESESPLYDEFPNFTAAAVRIGNLKPLFVNYFQNETDGLLRYRPSDVIESISRAAKSEKEYWNSATMNAGDSVETFWRNSFSEIDRNRFEDLKEPITLKTVQHMYEWIRILPVAIFKKLPGFDVKLSDWEKLTTTWNDAQNKKGFGYLDTNQKGHPLDKATRDTEFYQFIFTNLSGTADNNKKYAKLMSGIFELYGIIDISHLAALPSALIFDTLAKMFDEADIKIKIDGDAIHPIDLLIDILEENGSSLIAFNIEDGRGIADELGSEEMEALHRRVEIVKPVCLRLNLTENKGFLLEPSETFYHKFSQIKQEAIKTHPEFATSTIFEMLVHKGSHPSDTSRTTRPEEIPSLVKATSQLSNFGVTNRKHIDEKLTSQFFRHTLLGTPYNQMSRVQQVVITNNIPENLKLFSDKITEGLSLELADNFTSQNMEYIIHERMKIFRALKVPEVEEPNHDLAVIEYLIDCLKSVCDADDEQMKLRPFYNKLEEEIENGTMEFINMKVKDNYDKVVLQSHLDGLKRVCSYLQSLTFRVHRQERFLKGQMKPGEGVSFQFQGSIDAMRSQNDNFIAVVNTTTSIKPDQIRHSAKMFFKDFGGDDLGNGKVFIQTLKNGPTASITLMSQRAATIEIVKNFQSVVTKMSNHGLAPVIDTRVHPYSFLRNMLWMSTFRNKWLQKPSRPINDVFDIPTKLIKTIFGQPESIEQAINSVQQQGDMSGINLSRHDRAAWKNSRFVVDYDKLNADEKKHRLRSNLTIADMLFINVARLSANMKKDTEEDRTILFNRYIREPKQLDVKYEHIFGARMERARNRDEIGSFEFSNKVDAKKPQSGEKVNPLRVKLGQKSDNDAELIDEWKKALAEWIKYNEKYIGKVNNAESPDISLKEDFTSEDGANFYIDPKTNETVEHNDYDE